MAILEKAWTFYQGLELNSSHNSNQITIDCCVGGFSPTEGEPLVVRCAHTCF